MVGLLILLNSDNQKRKLYRFEHAACGMRPHGPELFLACVRFIEFSDDIRVIEILTRTAGIRRI
jgi:hypothetical protein